VAFDPIEVTGGIAIGTGLGGAIADTVEPRLRQFKIGESSKYLYIPLPVGTVAALAAEGEDAYYGNEVEASYSGWDAHRLNDLYRVTVTAPGMGELLQLLRRGKINPGNFTHGLRKAKLEPMWDDALADLANVKLSPQEVALGIVRSILADPGFIPGPTLDISGRVPAYPVSPIDAVAEAALSGVDKERLRVMTGEIGLPPSTLQASLMEFRNIIDRGDVNRAGLESDTRPEWIPYIYEFARQILTAEQACELQLRGYLNRTQRLALTQHHGMTDPNSDLLYDLLGRGLNLHSAFIAERRGGVFGGPIDAIPDYALWMLQRGNLRPETYNMAWAARETFPSYFVTRALLQAGAISPTRGHELFMGLGWPEDVATSASKLYGAGTATAADPHVTKALNHEWTVAQSSYVNGEADAAAVAPTFTALSIGAPAQAEILASWDRTRTLRRKRLSAAQAKKAYSEAVTNPETGTTWTHDEAIAYLVSLGYGVNDAATFLEI
jgi:hypothetical protein